MVTELDTRLVSKGNRALDKFVSLTREYSDDIITLSAAHIEDAKFGRGHYGKAYAMESSSSVRLAYNITFYMLWHYFIILVITTHCVLQFYMDNMPYFVVLETLCVVCYIVDTLLHIVFYTPKTFFKLSKTALKSKLQFVLTILFISDLCYIMYKYFKTSDQLIETAIPFQFLRPYVFIIKIKTVYHIFMVVIKTFSRILRTLFAIILFILFFSCVAVHIFGEIYEKSSDEVYKEQFSHAPLAFIRMFALITTENYPNVMEPAYEYHKASFFFFVVFIYFGVFILMSILLAIVVDNYWTIAKMNVKKERLRGRKELAIAWNLLGDGAEKLSVYDENLLMVFRMLKPDNDDEEIIIFLQQLTSSINKSIIEYKSWLTRGLDILDLEVERVCEEEEETNLMSGLVKKSGGKCMIYLTLTIQSATLQRAVIILLFLHTILILVFKTGEEQLELIVQWFRVGISVMFVMEVFLRFSVLAYLHWEDSSGRNRTFSDRFVRWVKRASHMNVADVCLVLLGTFANVMWFYVHTCYVPSNGSKMSVYIAKGLCVVGSTILFILRLLVNSAEATKMFTLARLIIPVMFDLSALFFICVFSLASLGETAFTDYVREPPGLDVGSMSTTSCKQYGFGTHWCSFVTLFQVSTTSNWHEVMEKIIDSSAGYGGAVYFILTYIILHMVIINLFVAISYEAYNKFVSKPKQSRRKESAREKKKFGERIKLKLGKFGKFFNQYTTGNRKSVSSSPRPARRASVMIKRKSLHGMHEKISDSSLGEGIPDFQANGGIEVQQAHDMSSLPREKRHEMILKQRMQQKGEAKGRARRQRNTGDKVGSFADVVRQYTAQSDEEISLSAGQKIKVLDKAGTKYKGLLIDGPDAGKNGWFPAYILSSFVSEMNATVQDKRPPPKADSQPKFVKKQNADWTKDIIGPMTIMNPEELRELNKILKANARGQRSSTDSHRGSIDSPLSPKPPPSGPGPRVPARTSHVPIMNIVEEEEEDEGVESDNDNVFVEINKLYSKPTQLPEVIIEQPSVILEDEEEEELDQQHLQSPKVHTPESKAKEKWKKKLENKNKDIPEWARKFMTNSKVSDSSIKSPEDSDNSDPLSKAITPEQSIPVKSEIEKPAQKVNLLKGFKIKLPSKDVIIENTSASPEASQKRLDIPEFKEPENKSTVLEIPDSPKTEVSHNIPAMSAQNGVTVVLPIEQGHAQNNKNKQGHAQNNKNKQDHVQNNKNKQDEGGTKSKFWSRNKPKKMSRSDSEPAGLPSSSQREPSIVVRSGTEVKIVVQPTNSEQVEDFV